MSGQSMSRLRAFAGRKHLVGVLSALIAICAVRMPAAGQEPGVKARLKVQEVEATASVLSSASAANRQALEQIIDAANSQLTNALEQTRKFELAPKDMRAVIREQDWAQSGNVSRLDPQTAKAFQMAGVKYVGVVRVDNFQDITARMQLEGGLGSTKAERRTIQIQAVVTVVDATKGTILRSTGFPLERVATNETMAGSTVEGRSTNSLIGEVSAALARRAANEITDAIYPAKVVGYTMGVISFNRTKGSGVEPGQYWEVFAPGQMMVDPDTGESLGAEEISVGWAVTTESGEKFSKAEAIVDNGIDRNFVLRRRERLAEGLNPLARARGSAGAGGGVVPAAPAATPAASSPAAVPVPPATTAAPESGGAPAADAASGKVMRLAIFVKNREKQISDEKVMFLEDQISAVATDTLVEVIHREDVANAVARFAREGANAGTNAAGSDMTDRLLSDSASATALSQMLGADALIIASIGSLNRETRDYDDGTNKTKIDTYMLRCTYRILDGGTGGALSSGEADAETAIRQTANLTIKSDPTNDLLTDSGRKIGGKVKAQVASTRMRRPTPAAEEVDVQVNISLADMRIPRLKKTADGDFIVAADQVDVGILNAELLVDGVSAGSANGTFKIKPGLHRIKLQRPLMATEERMINVKPGLVLYIPMRLTDEGRRQWMENAQWFNDLRDGEALREGKLAKAKAFAEFLRNSHFKVDLDTSGWGGLISW